ncbi:glycosyltransferase [Microcoleus sp. herbarium2]|uniref:glycosyltransferase n=1 Tax=Microcoleus sp. herbarium2 TaxID=3055433 RepID=UPI002FD60D7F
MMPAPTASEALACGTPVVAFDMTGLKDIVDRQQNGYLTKPYETEDLARGIAWVLEDPDRHQKLCRSARLKVEENLHYKCKLAPTKIYMKKSCKQLMVLIEESKDDWYIC